MELVFIFLLIKIVMMVIFVMDLGKEKVFIRGVINLIIKENGIKLFFVFFNFLFFFI